jgi:hypothetical protein
MKVLLLMVFSVAFLGFPKPTEAWCGLASSASPLLSSSSASSSCAAVSSRQHRHHRQRSASFSRLAAAAESNSDKKSAEINIEAIKAELTEYLKKRKEMNADDLAKEYVRYGIYHCRLLDLIRLLHTSQLPAVIFCCSDRLYVSRCD